jgi:hypothetical protein
MDWGLATGQNIAGTGAPSLRTQLNWALQGRNALGSPLGDAPLAFPFAVLGVTWVGAEGG